MRVWCHRVLFSPHAENIVASCSYDMTVRLWDVAAPQDALLRVRNSLLVLDSVTRMVESAVHSDAAHMPHVQHSHNADDLLIGV